MSDIVISPEFIAPLEEIPDAASRREFLRVMGASIALAGAGGCGTRQPEETIVPYVQQPENLVPGKPKYYATAMEHDGGAEGLLVESHMFRPTKIDGNPLHPAVPETMRAANERFDETERIRFGASSGFAQSAVLSLYDPERSQVVRRGGRIRSWDDFAAALGAEVEAARASQGAGLCILTETAFSPTLLAQLDALQQELPQSRWFQWEPLNRDNEIAGSRLAFGEDVLPRYRVENADVIVSLDADFLSCGSMPLADARAFASRREAGGETGMNRLYVLESAVAITGAAADHRLGVRPSEVEAFSRLLAGALGIDAPGPVWRTGTTESEALLRWVRAIADDLRHVQENGGASLLVAGRWQPPAVHAMVHWINDVLGNVGRSVEYAPPPGRSVLQNDQIGELADAMRGGEVKTLLVLGGNPVYSAAADVDFTAALEQVRFTAHLGLYEDETSAKCEWHIPQAHFLESWSDTRSRDGTVSIVQPLIAPLYSGKSAHELMAAVAGSPTTTSHDVVREYWKTQWGEESAFESRWRQALHAGVIEGTAASGVQVNIRGELAADLEAADQSQPTAADGELVAVFRPDPSVWDGRFAANAWLQELPRPFTKITWDNAALVSPATARERELATGDVVEIAVGERIVRVPIWVLPGQPDGVVGLQLGYGRTRGGGTASGVGADVYPLRATDSMWYAPLELRKLEGKHAFATTQHHHHMEGRHLVRHGTLADYEEHPDHPEFVHPPHAHAPETETTLYPVPEYKDNKWGMTIDQSKCTGCNGCVIACQAENNIPVVGKEQVAAGREMHWLRIDHYYDGPPDNPQSFHQPMLCQHCEYAPCEVVCPVFATSHSSEGLNEMTYNRCVGTRYCSNNCPYKVRRFNYFDYNADLRAHQVLQLLPNPDVTVRSRGVMEKCTFCVQRISAARISAEKQDRDIRDGEVVTACQAACPSEAIVFGNLNDETSRVREISESPLGYGVLEDLNTRPRITYLAAVKNPNPALVVEGRSLATWDSRRQAIAFRRSATPDLPRVRNRTTTHVHHLRSQEHVEHIT